MQIKRKIQMAAAAVILNGAVALMVLQSSPAVAGSCAARTAGCTESGECWTNPTAWCESLQPGCTVTSVQCYAAGGLCGSSYMYICNYST